MAAHISPGSDHAASDIDDLPPEADQVDNDVDDIDDDYADASNAGGDIDSVPANAPKITSRGYCFDPKAEIEDEEHKGISQALEYHKKVLDAQHAQELYELGMWFPFKRGKLPKKKRQQWHAAYSRAHASLTEYRLGFARNKAAAKAAREDAKTTTTLPDCAVREMDKAIRKSAVCPNQARVAMRAALAAVQALAPGASDADVEAAASVAAAEAAEKLAESIPKAD